MALVQDAKTSSVGFALGFSVLFVWTVFKYVDILTFYLTIITCAYIIVLFFTLRLKLGNRSFQVAVRATFLGVVFGFGVIVSIWGGKYRVFGWYACIMSTFHFSEFLVTAITNPKSLRLDSFLISHSLEYGIAAVASWIEFFVEMYLFPVEKFSICQYASVVGICMCIFGEIVRKSSMFTAGTNFNHLIQLHREPGHVLVTRGMYGLFRHPAYVGWFWWSIGTQFVLCNPVCVVAYILASWRFFSARIMEEEITLLNFFGEDYVRYQRLVGTGLPFISGYKLD